ncbi:MAG TPA: hypothetical protein VG223_05475 [Solirubrobacteraceae bacterium]|nr:hypothetical protein [Solirubrobacteraceae bacterium]
MSSLQLRRALLGALAALCTLGVLAPAASADHTQTSIFQDDQYLLYASPAKIQRTLVTLKNLGVQELRITMKWSAIAPSPFSRTQPGGYFFPANPSSYPQGNWKPYDRIVELAAKYGLHVLFTVTGPGPLWATANHPPSAVAANHWYLNPTAFQEFVYAAGLRYSGRYFNIPAVTAWSVWNEPDQPGWLAPQTLRVKGQVVAVAPQLYRDYVDAAWSALVATGHIEPSNTILIGELAPEGDSTVGNYTPMTPMPFMRDLYCVSGSYQPLTGTAAKALGCPTTAAAQGTFAQDNPALFQATGFAHHPYYFYKAPSYSSPNPNWVPIANIGRLERGLDSAMAAWGVNRHIPIYYTEYGYQTKPPDPYQVVTPAQQAAYLNEADYMAYRNPRVVSVSQFELYDSPPNPLYKRSQFDYWDTFQTGLLFVHGKPKPALAAYRLPIWIPGSRFGPGGTVSVWGQIRPADGGAATTAEVQWRGATGGFRTLTKVTTANVEGYFSAHVRPPGTGTIRLLWGSYASRSATVTQT